MQQDDLTLAAPTPALEADFWSLVGEFDAAGESYLNDQQRDLAHRDFAAYVMRLEAYARGEQLPPGYVPSVTYWLVRNSTEIMGSSSLRLRLTPELEDVGGHIGYSIRPTARRQGFGTRILTLTLEQARAHALERVLLTCDTDNIASARIIQRHGGVLTSQGVSPLTATHVSRYWIAL